MGESIADRPLSQPHRDRLAPDDPYYNQICAAHERAQSLGDPGYPNPRSGLFVLTASYLAARGRCCDSGCRHCPYLR